MRRLSSIGHQIAARLRRAAPAAGALALGGCAMFYEAREIDDAPTVTPLETPRAPGDVAAGLSIYTGGDQMRARPVEAGLILWVEAGGSRYQQLIASCKDLGKGNIEPPPEGAADQAFCDRDTYLMAIEPTRVAVWVNAMTGDPIAEIVLP